MLLTKETASINERLKLGGILRCLPKPIYNALTRLSIMQLSEITELRLTAMRPLLVYTRGGFFFLTELGQPTANHGNALQVTKENITETFGLMCESSVYAKKEDIKQGFITLEGGHRAGICGSAVIQDGLLTTLKDISAINIRIAHQAIGAADGIMDKITGIGGIYNTLIISPPGCGKTTLLRDIARQLGSGYGSSPALRVGIADERGEIAAVYKGIAQNNVGVKTVVMDSCPKVQAMLMLLRSMGPEVIITDEIGSVNDVEAINSVLNAGVKVIASIHGFNVNDILNKKHIASLIGKSGFSCIVTLSKKHGAGTVEGIDYYDC